MAESHSMADSETVIPTRPQSPFQSFSEPEHQIALPDATTNHSQSRSIQDISRSGEKAVETLRTRIGGLSINQGKTHPLLSTNDVLWASKPYNIEPQLPEDYSGVLDMPTRTIQEHLIEIYFRRHYQIIPMFSRKVFSNHLSEKGYLISPLILNAMYAHACTYEADLQQHADVFFDRARSLVEDFLDVPRIGTIFALLLMATYERRSSEDKSSRRSCRPSIYAGMATSMCLEMKLQKTVHDRKMTEFDVELRKRMFWMCYNLDKKTSLGSQRPVIIANKDVSISLPNILPDDEDSASLEAFAALTRLMLLCEKFLDLQSTTMSEPGYMQFQNRWSELQKDLSDWLTSLPRQLTWTPPPEIFSPIPVKPPQSAAIAMLHLEYNVIEHRILSSSSHKSAKSVHRRIRTVANTITQLAHFLVNDVTLLSNYDYCAYAVLLAALTHATDLQHTTPQVSLQSEVQLRRSVAIIGFLSENRMIAGCGSFSALVDTVSGSAEFEDSRNLSPLQMQEKTKAFLENLNRDSNRLQPQGVERLPLSKHTSLQHITESNSIHSGQGEHPSSLPPITNSDAHSDPSDSQPRFVPKYGNQPSPESSKLLEPAHYTFELISVDDNWGYASRVPANTRTLDHQQQDPARGMSQPRLTVHSSPSSSIHDHGVMKTSRHVTPPPPAGLPRHYSPPEMDTPPPDPRTLWNHTSNTIGHSPSSEDTILYSIAASATGWVDDSEKWYSGHQSQAAAPMPTSQPQSLPSMGIPSSSKFVLQSNELTNTTSITVPSSPAHHLVPDQHSHALIDHMHVDTFT
jgi:hypothetical protein